MKIKNIDGFSLTELIIVIAITAVLLAVLTPAFLAQIEKSYEGTDLANVRSAYGEVMNAAIEKNTSSSLYDPSTECYVATVSLKQRGEGWTTSISSIVVGGCTYSDDENISRMINVPKSGGTCTITYDTETNLVLIDWGGDPVDTPKEPPKVSKNPINVFLQAVIGDHKGAYYTTMCGSWDSTYSAGNMTNVWNYLKSCSEFDSENIKTWTIINSSPAKVSVNTFKNDNSSLYYVWSTKDINTCKTGEYVPVMMMNTDSSGNTTYTVGNVKVTNGDKKTYNVISNGENTVRPNKNGYDINKVISDDGKQTFTNYEDAARYYDSITTN